jgi:hypothetical protein
MELFDAIIVGSGPAGTFSAYGLQGKRILVLDVGHTPEASPTLNGNLDDLRRESLDLFEPLIGSNFESMHNLHLENRNYKLKSPYMSYILKDWQTYSPVETTDFETMMSFAKGGLANAWGAGAYQFSENELNSFPFSECDLCPLYQELTDHIGITGEHDDLATSFGRAKGLQPPLLRSRFANSFARRYMRLRELGRLQHIRVGAPRLAVLSQEHNGRQSYKYDGMDFFKPHNPAVYNPAYTMDELTRLPTVEYLSGFLVLKYVEMKKHIEVSAQNIAGKIVQVFRAKKLILAAGALNTTKIVLASNNDYTTQLPIMENPMACIPIVDYKLIGSKVTRADSPLAQLNLIYEGDSSTGPVQASLYGSTGPLRTDVTFGFPLSIGANISLMKYIAPASGLMMVFFPGSLSKSNYVALNRNNSLEISYAEEVRDTATIKALMHAFRKMGYICMEALNQYPRAGNSLHYAAIFPMKHSPRKYQTHPDGRLSGTEHVYIADSACFPGLPAKNLTFTIMANALRIGRKLYRKL